MKKFLLILAVVLFAQTAKATGNGYCFGLSDIDFCMGPKVGYQTAALSFKKADIKAGLEQHLTAGLFARLTIKDFIIQPELLWFKSGQVFNLDIDPSVEFQNHVSVDMNPTVTLTQQNLALPIFIGYQIDGDVVRVRGNVGPVMYFVLSQKQRTDTDSGKESVNMDNLDTQNMTWGAALNLGVDVWRLTLDINYSFGLSNFFGTDNVDWSFNGDKGTIKLDKTKQNMFTVTLGFKFFD